jgi:hypothetical protein
MLARKSLRLARLVSVSPCAVSIIMGSCANRLQAKLLMSVVGGVKPLSVQPATPQPNQTHKQKKMYGTPTSPVLSPCR